jgi:hypothetical protein
MNILPLSLAALLLATPAMSHDIYRDLTIKDSTVPCCGGESSGAYRDCWRTTYRERGAHFQFRMNNGDWVEVPTDRIQFTPIPGDRPGDDTHEAHLCYRDDAQTLANYHDHGVTDRLLRTVNGAEVVFYCGIIPPGGL